MIAASDSQSSKSITFTYSDGPNVCTTLTQRFHVPRGPTAASTSQSHNRHSCVSHRDIHSEPHTISSSGTTALAAVLTQS